MLQLSNLSINKPLVPSHEPLILPCYVSHSQGISLFGVLVENAVEYCSVSQQPNVAPPPAPMIHNPRQPTTQPAVPIGPKNVEPFQVQVEEKTKNLVSENNWKDNTKVVQNKILVLYVGFDYIML